MGAVLGAAAGPIGLALSAVSAIGQIQAGRAQAKGLAAQATMERMRAKQEALKYRQQGVDVLRNIVQTNATINARAAAGGIDPFSGSAKALQIFALAQGSREYATAQDNAIMTIRGGELQAQQYQQQAKSAVRAGFFNAAATLGTAAMSYGKLGGAPSSGLTRTGYTAGVQGGYGGLVGGV